MYVYKSVHKYICIYIDMYSRLVGWRFVASGVYKLTPFLLRA